MKVFDATSGEPLLILNQTAEPTSAVFSPDGKRLAVSSFDNLIHVYTLDIDELKGLARSRVTRSLTAEECQQYLHLEECPAGF